MRIRSIEGGAVRAVVLAIALLCSACVVTRPPPDGDRQWVAQGAGLIPADTRPPDSASLLAVSDEMRALALEAVGRETVTKLKLKALTQALSFERLGLRYDPGATLSAREAFEQKRVNCLSYTLMFVAMAREAGIAARFNDVAIPPIWDLKDDQSYILYRHINLRVDTGPLMHSIVDIAMAEYDLSYPQTPISDREAYAHYYNNRAAELRFEGRFEDALRYQLHAIRLAPERPYFWDNLSQLYLQLGEVRAARISIDSALAMSPPNATAFDTAVRVYRAAGDDESASRYLRRARQMRQENPYFHYRNALASLEQQRNDAAYDDVKRAIALYPNEHRFYFLKGLLLLRMGEPRLARRSFDRAVELSADDEQRERYRNKLSALRS